MKRKDEADALIQSLRKSGLTYAEIQRETGISITEIGRSLRRSGLILQKERENLVSVFPEHDDFCLLQHHRVRLEEVRLDIIRRCLQVTETANAENSV